MLAQPWGTTGASSTMSSKIQKADGILSRIKAASNVPRSPKRVMHPLRAGTMTFEEGTTRQQQQHPDILETLFTETQLKTRIDELGRTLASDYQDKEPLVIGTLSGAFVFMADLVRAIYPVPAGLSLDFLRASSYEGTNSTGVVKLDQLNKIPVSGRHVILVEDIVDTGTTAAHLLSALKMQGAASVTLITLLDKAERRKVAIQPDYIGFKCPNEFVVGYGLDHNEHYRSLPYVGVLRPECYCGE